MRSEARLPIVEELRPPQDPVLTCERLAGLPYRVFLDSAARDGRLGRFSFVMADPVAVVRSRGPLTEIVDSETGVARVFRGDALSAACALILPHAADPVPDAPPFQGGVAGYLAYDWGRTLERLPAPRCDDLGLWDVVLGVYDWVLAWDHVRSTAWLISTGLPETSVATRARRAAARAAAIRARLDGTAPHATTSAPCEEHPTLPPTVVGHRKRVVPLVHTLTNGWWTPAVSVASSFTRDGYLGAVSRVRAYIAAGDVFQVNLSQRLESALAVSPWTLYRRLRERNPAPFSAFLDLPEAAIVSASPERFLRVDPSRRVETRPIKGTRPRGRDASHDDALGRALVESPKDRAENLMIVDLMRNDLSRVCSPGTVQVPELFALETHPTVHHLVSTVTGRLEAGMDAADLLRAAFPGGSVTGAPKIRSMEIIAELEPTARGVYCGSVGYWSVTGELDMSIAIRTAVAVDGWVYFGAGGGIVADSDPEQEYGETLDKARALIDTLASFA